MYQAVCDMLSDASRREIVLRAELVVAREELAAQKVENDKAFDDFKLAFVRPDTE